LSFFVLYGSRDKRDPRVFLFGEPERLLVEPSHWEEGLAVPYFKSDAKRIPVPFLSEPLTSLH
jgi:hypothetical protein